ncbi:TPA: HD domain-containing protein [Vibrio vulnificus]|uniref:HD-GYP domain-containing protein n=1 Tax=Vibrio vulnificus TaxID=672 RepID=UPI001A23B2B3|nr:HD domain-containing phosphohydrolase [Vibrio vulnificus]MCG6303594.1 HD domain-containing protein [Vibrio vulnificus]HAS8175058.1 HD domain-containing protein [Vibrio vulnificus]
MTILENKDAYHLIDSCDLAKEAYLKLKPMRTYSLETYQHTIRVATLAYWFGQQLMLDVSQSEFLFISGLLHDIGKMKTPLEILHKSGRFSPSERKIMNEHAFNSYLMAKDNARLKNAALIGCLHHERWDGTGYPLSLKGNQIPYLSQIISIVDVWDAMVSDRIYRKGMSQTAALSVLKKEKFNGQFDPSLVERFTTFILGNTCEYGRLNRN